MTARARFSLLSALPSISFGVANRVPSRWRPDLRNHGGKQMSEIVWKCEQAWAGQLYNRMVFNTREEAEDFVSTGRQAEPDQMFSIEAIRAEQVWN